MRILKSNTKVSVIVTVYNKEDVIIRTLESLGNQIILPFEVIIIEDKSTDDSLNLIVNYINDSKKNIWKLIANNSNKGVSVSRNIGINKISGDLVMFLDGDDMYDDTFIKEVIKIFNHYKFDILSVPMLLLKTKTVKITLDRFKNTVKLLDNDLYEIEDVVATLYYEDIFGGGNTIVQAKLLNKIRFNETCNTFEDWDFWFRLSMSEIHTSSKILFFNKPLYIYNNITEDLNSLSRRKISVSNIHTPCLLETLSKYNTDKTIKKYQRRVTIIWFFNLLTRCSSIYERLILLKRFYKEIFSSMTVNRHTIGLIIILLIGSNASKNIGNIYKSLFEKNI